MKMSLEALLKQASLQKHRPAEEIADALASGHEVQSGAQSRILLEAAP